jgi:hypothetical protein
VGAGVFEPRLSASGEDQNGLRLIKSEYLATGGFLGVKPIVAVIGGLHLFAASDQALAWTGAKLKAYGVQSLLAGHCTGIEAPTACANQSDSPAKRPWSARWDRHSRWDRASTRAGWRSSLARRY